LLVLKLIQQQILQLKVIVMALVKVNVWVVQW
jgi:hypothetical protein